jgi:hypothetical protein
MKKKIKEKNYTYENDEVCCEKDELHTAPQAALHSGKVCLLQGFLNKFINMNPAI